MTLLEFTSDYPHMNYLGSNVTDVEILNLDYERNLMFFKITLLPTPHRATEEYGVQVLNPSGSYWYYIFSVLGEPFVVKIP